MNVSARPQKNTPRLLAHASRGALISLVLAVSSGLNAAPVSTDSKVSALQASQYRTWITQMKTLPRGPFARLRWFCADGRVLPPKPYACGKRGGEQHGEWSAKTKKMRQSGLLIANVLADADAKSIAEHYSPDGELQAILIEQFLLNVDDGWILRKARFYRGAFQIESEERVGNQILTRLTAANQPIAERYALILEAVKNLPSTRGDQQLLSTVRSSAVAIQNQVPRFGTLRNKIHGKLDAKDAQRVREFARDYQGRSVHKQMLTLAAHIDSIFAFERISKVVADLALSQPVIFASLAQQWSAAKTPGQQYQVLASASKKLREQIEQSPKNRIERFNQVAQLEQIVFAKGRQLLASPDTLSRMSRADLLNLLAASHDMLYGVGLLMEAELQQADSSIQQAQKSADKELTLAAYQRLLKDLDRVPVWAERRLQFFFQGQVQRFSQIEPKAHDYIPDRLRGSPLLIYTAVLNQLNKDSSRLSGISHRFFKAPVSRGFRVLNPGVARGLLLTPQMLAAERTPPEGLILVVPETLADLPAVTGLLTAFEGNQLSHVQLLARNLGVPNVVVGPQLLAKLKPHYGQRIELLASAGGVVEVRQLAANEAINQTSAGQQKSAVTITVDADKLDLTQTLARSTKDLDSSDSGVSVGPKAAKVAQLSQQFPGQVSPGLAIPFGTFRKLLDDNQHASGVSMFEWIRSQYKTLNTLHGTAKTQARRQMLSELRSWFMTVKLDPEFVADLKRKMRREFGPDGSYGVFVRSDTNVEDLPGFTGAGLNLTVTNAVGFDVILHAIREVWASPFSERAFGWRQARMNQPEHVYTAILLHKSVASDKSGVLVTTDVFNQQPDKLTVVLNEGVSGGVDGLSAQSVLIDKASAHVDLHTSATAPYKTVLLKSGGATQVPASGKARQLSAGNVKDLITFSNNVGQWFSDDPHAIADVEFGFLNEQFVLFQIRPLVESKVSSLDARLTRLDQALNKSAHKTVDLKRPTE